MTNFEQAYTDWLERLASAQDDCEKSVAVIVQHLERDNRVPARAVEQYDQAHAKLGELAAARPPVAFDAGE